MSYQPSLVTTGDAGLDEAIAAGRPPQTIVAIMPEDEAMSFVISYASLLLCDTGTGTDGCPSCRAWAQGGHPDLVIAGPGDRAPKMEVRPALTREVDIFQGSIALKRVVARRRLGVVPYAQDLSIDAENALLKTAEEPPSDVHILIWSTEDVLLPTIKSRAWIFRREAGSTEPAPPPTSPAEWGAWFEQLKKKKPAKSDDEREKEKKASPSDVLRDIDSWAEYLAERGEWRKSADLKNLIYLSEKRHMPSGMVQDAAHAILREGIGVEQLFGDLREA